MTYEEKRINDYFEKYVPGNGKADTLLGELVRAISRIGYRNYNDGDHIGVGYGRETCSPAARFIVAKVPEHIGNLVYEAWGLEDDDAYDRALQKLEAELLVWIDENEQELKQTANSEDMWDYATEEDVDEYDEEEEYEEVW